MVNVAVRPEGQIVRPLRVLVPLIKEDLKHAEDAGLPYKQAAGEKLVEAKTQLQHGEWGPWLDRNFALSPSRARIYMNFAKAIGDQKERIASFPSLNEFHRQTGSSAYRNVTSKRDWHEGVKESVDHAKREAERIREGKSYPPARTRSRAEARATSNRNRLQGFSQGIASRSRRFARRHATAQPCARSPKTICLKNEREEHA